MSERNYTPKEIIRLEKTRQASDEKLLKGDEGGVAELIKLEDGGQILNVDERQLELIRKEMESDIAGKKLAPAIKEKLSLINEADERVVSEYFEKKFVDTWSMQSKISFRLNNAVAKRGFDQFCASGFGLSHDEESEIGRSEDSVGYVDKISNESTIEDFQNAHREIFSKVRSLVFYIWNELNENLWSSSSGSHRLKEIFSDIEHVRAFYPKFDPVGKTGIEPLRKILIELKAGLKFDDKYHPDAIRILGIFRSAQKNVEEVLDMIAEFEAKLVMSEYEVKISSDV